MEIPRHTPDKDHPSAEVAKILSEVNRPDLRTPTMIRTLALHDWAFHADGSYIYCSQQWLDYAGFTPETACSRNYRETIHPDDVGSFNKRWKELSDVGGTIEAEARLRRFDGEYRWFLVGALPVRDGDGKLVMWLGTNTDIDDRKKAEALLGGENRILEMIATGKPLAVVLEELCLLFDSIAATSMASVLLVDSENKLRRGAGPNLPEELMAACEGLKIGPFVGNCGTAAYRREAVIVADIETSPLWDGFRELARRHGLRAGWSTPIFSSEGRVLGTFGILWRTPQGPKSVHARLIDSMTHLASVAIERQHSQEALRASERFARGQADTLTRTLDEIARESSFDRIAEYVLRLLTRKFEAAGSSVFLLNATTGLMDLGFVLERGRIKTRSDPKIAAVYPSFSWQDIRQWRDVFEGGKPYVLADIRQGTGAPWRPHVVSQGIITILLVPTFVAGKPAGAFGIRFKQERQFSPGEMDLAQALANQAMLAMQLTQLSEESRRSAVIGERNRLAREVHDTLAQGLIGIIIQLEAARQAMAQGLPVKLSGHLERARDLARESLQEARLSVKALRPQALAENSLSMALKDLFAKMTVDTPLVARLTVDGEPRQLPEDWENNLLRIGQEALTNAVRHSQATEFHGRLTFDDHEVRLHLRDNGAGFDAEKKHEGLGLQGMRERAAAMGGQLSISSGIGNGTTVSIVSPKIPGANNDETIS